MLILTLSLALAKPKIVVEKAWVRLVPKVSKVSAMFFTLKNLGDEDDYLLGGSSDICERVEIHKTVMVGDRVKMVKIDRLKVSKHSEVVFKRGSFHIMLINLKRPLKEGERVKVLLKFEKSGKVLVSATVKRK